MWLITINDSLWDEDRERYEARRNGDSNGRTIEGLRYARHRLVHDINVYGLHGAINYVGWFDSGSSNGFDTSGPKWVWRDLEALQPAKRTEGENVYRKRLQGKDVEASLRTALTFLSMYHSTR